VPGATAQGPAIGTGVGVPDLGMRTPGTRRHADEASPLASVTDSVAPTTRPASSGIASATGRRRRKGRERLRADGRGQARCVDGSLASAAGAPTTRPATVLAASPLTGPAVGQPSGPIFASMEGAPIVEGRA